MAEQNIRHEEHIDKKSRSTEGTLSPAPMVERAFRLLDLLSLSEEGMTLSDLARALNMGKSSIHGLLKTLERSGAVEQSEERLYMLGPKIYDLAQSYSRHAGLRHFTLPAMQHLSRSIGETLFLGRVEQHGVRIIERVLPDKEQPSLHISAARGTRVHLLAGATGRVVLASWPQEQRLAFLQTHPLPHFTAHSITDTAQFLEAVQETELSGIGEDYEEYLSGVNAVAAPINGPGGELVAVLWAVGFSTRFHDEAIQTAGQQLREETKTISRSLQTGI